MTIATLSQVETPPPLSDLDEFELTGELSNLYSLAKTGKQRYQSQWRRNYLLATNRQNTLQAAQPYSANVTDSEIWPILSSRIAWMTDQKIQFDVAPASSPGSGAAYHLQILSQHLEQVLDTNWIVQSWDEQILLMLWDSALFGAGIVKAIWDSGADNGLGNAGFTRIDPWKFYPDPNATSFTDCQYMFEVNRLTYSEIERRFPSTSQALIEEAFAFGEGGDEGVGRPNAPSNYPMANPGNLPGSNSTMWGLPGQSTLTGTSLFSQGVNVYECWIRENYRMERETTDASYADEEEVVYDEWRVVVYSGNHVLLDELASNLWEENRHPYQRFVDEEVGEFWPVPITSHLAPCQIAINRLLSAVQGNAELAGNPIFMDVANSGLSRTAVVNRPGLRLQLNSGAANSPAGKPDWLRPPEIPQYVINLIQFWIGRMENISGLSGPQKGQPQSGRVAQQTVQATQEAGFVRVRSALRNLERTLAKCGNLVANLIIQNYDVPRVVAIVGDDGVDSSLRLAARHFYMPGVDPDSGKVKGVPMKFSLIVKAGSSSPTSRQARIAEADALFAMHAIDEQAVLEAHAWPNYQTVLQRMQAKAQAMAAAQVQAAGQPGGKQQPRGPGTGHPH